MTDNMYRYGDDILIVLTEDCTGRKLSKFRSNISNEKEVAKMFNSVIQKYRMNLKVVYTEKGFDWLKADEEFRL